MIITPNLKLYLPMEGNANDASDNDNNGTVYGAVLVADNELSENLVPKMTSNTAPEGEASASSEYSSSYRAWEAFNKSNSSYGDCWLSANVAFPHWLKYEFASAQIIDKYAITTRNYTSPHSPKDWTFEGSNDDSDWTTLDTQTDQFSTDPQNDRELYTITNTTEYKYYRLHITSGNGGGNYAAVGMLEMIGNTYSIVRFGQCYSFDGVDDYVEISDDASLKTGTGDLTIAMWTKISTIQISSYPVIISKGTFGTNGGYMIYIVNDKIRVYLDALPTGGFDSTISVNDNNWRHIGVTKKGNDLTLYLDGSEDNTAEQSGIDIDSNVSVGISVRDLGGTPNNFLKGIISNPMFFSKALNQSDIKRVMLGLHPLNG